MTDFLYRRWRPDRITWLLVGKGGGVSWSFALLFVLDLLYFLVLLEILGPVERSLLSSCLVLPDVPLTPSPVLPLLSLISLVAPNQMLHRFS